ncbi:hypothetical protein ACIA8K_38585 [Catenuloplanes sp. NPDC051500]|uniref:hypothetical protein n=1 Tax=Catenuloplanes sp. NPDC051500 TaxID=3363959 RepID=UPI0037B17745
MSDVKLSVPERALLFILMAKNCELSNTEIAEQYAKGLTLTGKNRLRLIDAELIECRKGARNAYFFTLADGGWHWCREELKNQQVPAGSGSAGQALYAVFNGLDQYLDRTGRSLAQMFGGLPEPQQASTLAADELEKAIRQVYRKAADPAGSWVGLADIRDELVDVPTRDIDGVLRLMARMPGVRIEEETNQKALTRRDRDAAVTIGDRDQHVLAIEDL